MTFILGAIAVLNALVYLAVVYAFRFSTKERGSATWWFVRGFAILAGAIVLRGLYWDSALPLFRFFDPVDAEAWTALVNGRMINIVFALMKFYAAYCAMKCRWMLIPDDERDEWPLWRAWQHPKRIGLLPWRQQP